MINPIHLIGILSLLAGWHLDAIDHALIEKHRARLNNLNQMTDQPAPLDEAILQILHTKATVVTLSETLHNAEEIV